MKILPNSGLVHILFYSTAMAAAGWFGPDVAQSISSHVREVINSNPDNLEIMRQIGVYTGIFLGTLIGSESYHRVLDEKHFKMGLDDRVMQFETSKLVLPPNQN